VRFVAASAHPQREYLATGFLRGYTLSHLMRNICPLPDDEVRKTIKALCDGLALVHERGYVHRDIKPENIILCPDGAVCLMDFGLAIRAETHASFFRRFAPTIGSADYMAPEQVQGKAWDARTDIYAVGALMYEMVTGVAPFAGTTPKEVMQARLQHDPVPPTRRNPNVSAGMEKIIQRALARDPSARYQSAAELKAALEALRC
jgi:serine/threonine-protein kinase